MQLFLTGRHVEVTPGLRQLVTRRLARVERLLNHHALSAQVVLTLEKRRHKTEVTIHARGDHALTGKGDAATWVQSVGEAIDKVLPQALKVKEKWVTQKRRGSTGKVRVNGQAAAAAARAEQPVAKKAPAIRARRYAVKPMSIEDAALSIQDAKEPFVVFRHADTERINILYARPDGRLGLIDPEV
jgi:putative sigma-54 modulation protein